METDTLILGGGLAGLSLAAKLTRAGRACLLFEARDRLGGRVLTQTHQGEAYDMGPAWFWPGQPRMAALIGALCLQPFDQHDEGALILEDERGQVQRRPGYAAMQSSYRLQGGIGALTEALAARLPQEAIHTGSQMTHLSRTASGVTAKTAAGQTVAARRVVMALPPRLAAAITFDPHLPAPALQALQETPTWMAGQAKAMAVYDHPFWRDAGLSGNAMSRRGPMVEVHDASPADGASGALFGFVGIAPADRRDETLLRRQVLGQLVRLFGPEASAPVALLIKDWARDPLTAAPTDQAPLMAHPRYGLPPALRTLWDGLLLLGGTEVAPTFGGYLEGALEAAEMVHAQLMSANKATSDVP